MEKDNSNIKQEQNMLEIMYKILDKDMVRYIQKMVKLLFVDK
jgi:hypothetical protein